MALTLNPGSMIWKPRLWWTVLTLWIQTREKSVIQNTQLKVWRIRSPRVAAALGDFEICFDYSKILFYIIGILLLEKDYSLNNSGS